MKRNGADWFIVVIEKQVLLTAATRLVPHVVIITLQFISGHRGQISLPALSSALLQG